MMLRALTFLAATALASCTPSGPPPETTRATVATVTQALPPLRRFEGTPNARVPVQPNAQLARDFMALSFQLETGRQLPVFTRYEGPVTVAVEGTPPPTLLPDLDDLLERLRREAGIDITRAKGGEMGSITISALPRSVLQRYVPDAACFVVPRVSGWKDYMSKRFSSDTDWTTLRQRSRASVFLPADVSPQEIRDCLHEEVAQALGPLNDLYRLPHSLFNDDNIHVVLTSYDMMMLRATYDDTLRSGMTQTEVAARLPAIFARLNPRGRVADAGAVPPSTPAWTQALRSALAPGGSTSARIIAAERALGLAQAAGWRDARVPVSQMALGRATLPSDPDRAIASFLAAGTAFRAMYGDGIHAAQVAMQLAAFSLTTGQAEASLRIIDRAIPAADDAQNAGILSTLLLLRAEAMHMQGARAEAARTRREGLAWGRYAWGDAVLARRAAEVAGLSPGA